MSVENHQESRSDLKVFLLQKYLSSKYLTLAMAKRNNCPFFWFEGYKWLLLLVVIFHTPLLGQAQKGPVPEKYLKITPGVTTRVDIEKQYPKRDPNRTAVQYDTPDFSMTIQYSLGPCKLKLGRWGFPEGTVEEIYYQWPEGRKVRLNELLLSPDRFDKRQDGDVVGIDYYVNDEFGISVEFDSKLNEVVTMDFQPAAKFHQTYACGKEAK